MTTKRKAIYQLLKDIEQIKKENDNFMVFYLLIIILLVPCVYVVIQDISNKLF